MVPYLVFYRDVTDEQFQQLVSQLKPWGVPVLVYHRRANMRHLDTRGQKGSYMGLGSGSIMDRVFLGEGGSRAAKQFRHVLVPPAYAQQHAMRMHLGHQHVPPELYDKAMTEEAGDAFAVDERVADEEATYSGESPWRSSRVWTCSTLSEQCRQTRRERPWQYVVTTSHGSVVSTQRLANGTMTCRKLCTRNV